MEKNKSIHIKNKSIHIWTYSILGVALVLVAVWGIGMQRNSVKAQAAVENQYNRAFHDLVSYIDDIDVLLTKAQLAGTSAQVSKIASEIFRESSEAKACLGELPSYSVPLDKTSKFLSQVGDYTYVLSQDMINGTEISDEAYKNLASLNEYASNLKTTLSDIEEKLYSGEIKLSDLSKKNNKNTAYATGTDILTDLQNVEKSFEEYPSLIYDGPFSEHIENRESVMLKSAKDFTMSDAKKKAEEFLGIKGRNLKFQNLSKNTAICSYTFVKADENDDISISITQKGGYVLYYLDNRDVNMRENYNVDTASKIALSFLESHGYTNMVKSYFEKKNNIATINFAYSQDDIICYSDLVKVKVALDTGEVIGLESKGYLMNHTDKRDLSNEIISVDEAKATISSHLNVTSAGLCLIPKDSMQEILCYEFHGTFKDKNFLIYVNALNGREEKILLLIESEEGVLTV